MQTPLTSQFWKQFKTKSCCISLKSNTKADVLEEVVGNLVSGGALPAELEAAALEALQERERLASTGVGRNVAIPHVKLAGLTRAVANLSVHREGVDWAAVDGEPVKVVFTVLRPDQAGDEHDPETHLEMMHWIAGLARKSDFRRFSVNAKTKKELVDLLKEMSST